jgi:hypothetical protein
MSEEVVLRQPCTLWQWLSGQPGTIYTPPLPPPPQVVKVNPPRSALDYIESELKRLHEQLDELRYEDVDNISSQAGMAFIAAITRLHEELVKGTVNSGQAPT